MQAMQTCYYCVVGHQKAVSRGTQYLAGSGFGSCQGCWVHACPHHGDKVLGYDFQCVDCIVTTATTSAVSGPPPDLGARPDTAGSSANAFERVLHGNGALGLLASAPGVAVAALPLVAQERFALIMERVLQDLLRDLVEHPGVAQRWAQTARGQVPPAAARNARAAALGIFVTNQPDDEGFAWFSPEELAALSGSLNEVINLRIRQLCQDAAAAFRRRQPGGPEAPPAGTVDLALLALGTAYAARGADSVDMNPWLLRGLLRLPGPVFVLAILFYARVMTW